MDNTARHLKVVNNTPRVDTSKLSMLKKLILGLQHTFTMFGATVLVPLITGFDISTSLFMAGIGTLIFHIITRFRVPAFLGSSFSFIAPVTAVAMLITNTTDMAAAQASSEFSNGLAYAQGGLVVAGLIYALMAFIITVFGHERVIGFFPPVVTGSIIMVIGLKLAPTAIDMASGNWTLAIITFLIVASVNVYGKGFSKVLPVLIGLVSGYIISILMGVTEFSAVVNTLTSNEVSVIGLPKFRLAKFSIETIMMVAPVALCTVIEHIGDVLAIGSTVGEDFIKSPGLNRTMLGDGIATSLSAMFGGPANTTYSENTGVLALTGVHDPAIVRIAAVFAIILGVTPRLGALVRTIPTPVIGGISIILFGMIASIGAKSLVENKVDFGDTRNLIVAASIFVLGLGGASLPVSLLGVTFKMEGMALAAIVGIILNKIFNMKKAVD